METVKVYQLIPMHGGDGNVQGDRE